MIKSMLRVGTASALVFAATVAVAQDMQPTDPNDMVTTADQPATTTKTKTKSKSKTKAPATATTPATTTESTTTTETTAPAAPAAPAAATATPAAPAPAPASTVAPAAAPTAAAPAAPAATAAATTPAAPAAAAAATTPNPAVGGAPMDAAKTIVDNASAAPNLTTLVGAVKAADLVATLSGPGPFTVFAPTNDAFSRVDQATLKTLMEPANKAKLAKILTYHVVPGTITAADLVKRADATAGTTTLTTVEGENLTVKVTKANGGAAVEITDVNGNKSYLETPDVRQSNGVVHVVNGVLFPKL